MAASMTSATAKDLARLGASLELDAKSFTSASLNEIAMLMRPGTTLKVANSDALTSTSLKNLAQLLGSRLIIA